jgi:hypothetical protein
MGQRAAERSAGLERSQRSIARLILGLEWWTRQMLLCRVLSPSQATRAERVWASAGAPLRSWTSVDRPMTRLSTILLAVLALSEASCGDEKKEGTSFSLKVINESGSDIHIRYIEDEYEALGTTQIRYEEKDIPRGIGITILVYAEDGIDAWIDVSGGGSPKRPLANQYYVFLTIEPSDVPRAGG